MSRNIEGLRKILRGEITQTKKNDRILDCWRLWLGRSGCGLFREWSGGNGCGLEVLSGSNREVLPRREPVIEFPLTGDGATENPALQFGELELLVGNRVVGVERGFRE